MRIVIVGAGEIGSQVAADLSEAGGHELVVIEADEARASKLAEDLDALVLHGDGTAPELLDKAEIHDADALVAATGSDATNTVVAMLGHRAEVDRIIVRLTSNALRGALDEIGVSEVVAPTLAAASRIEAAIHGESRIELAEAIQGRLQIAEVTTGQRVAGQRLGDLDIPDGAAVVAVIRAQEASLARPDHKLAEGDVLMVLSESEEALEQSKDMLSA